MDIDTPYSETAAEARHYQATGVQCVEMEAAAGFTGPRYGAFHSPTAFCMSDSLADAGWNRSSTIPIYRGELT